MAVRLASPDEAEVCWNIRNQAIRFGCQNCYDYSVIQAWTPERMPANYRQIIADNPFYIADSPEGKPASTGFLDLPSASVEAIFTLPAYCGIGLASSIIDAIKIAAKKRGFPCLTLSSTPNAKTFYEQHGFNCVREGLYPSALANAELRCVAMRFEF